MNAGSEYRDSVGRVLDDPELRGVIIKRVETKNEQLRKESEQRRRGVENGP